MRLVLDTNVVISALLWGGVPGDLLRSAGGRDNSLFTSIPMLLELGDVLSRPKLRPQIAAAQCTADQLVARYGGLASIVEPEPVPRIAPDPDDDVVIGTALAARAEMIVTGDRALLELERHGEIRIVTVAAALQLLSSDESR